MEKENQNKINKKINRDEYVRLNKFLSDAGVCSRREADRMIEQGRVTVDGVTASMGMKILPFQSVIADGKKVEKEEKMILIALNKPVGIECTTSKDVAENIVVFVGLDKRIYPVGRLDKNSEGLILLTNNGDIVNKIMKSSQNHEKEYIVTVNKDITEDFIYRMGNGIHIREVRGGQVILDCVTKKCKVRRVGKRTFNIVLTQGLNRQIRRMCRELGYRVTGLKRIRIMNIHLGELNTGAYRKVTDSEYSELMKSLNSPGEGRKVKG